MLQLLLRQRGELIVTSSGAALSAATIPKFVAFNNNTAYMERPFCFVHKNNGFIRPPLATPIPHSYGEPLAFRPVL
jgi:hypothetical protein